MPWTLEAGGSLRLTDRVDIFEAVAFHQVLLGLVSQGGNVHLDVTKCASLDTSALQLLLAFRREMGGRVSVAWGEPIGRLLARHGLDRMLGEDRPELPVASATKKGEQA
jgi:anti-anti-sigma regulatory factor